MARRQRESREVWAERVAAWRASGLSAGQYAEEHGVAVSSLYHWSKVLGKEASAGQRGFARVVVKPRAPEAAGLEIVLRSGRIVRVRGAVDAAQLQAVVAALESC